MPGGGREPFACPRIWLPKEVCYHINSRLQMEKKKMERSMGRLLGRKEKEKCQSGEQGSGRAMKGLRMSGGQEKQRGKHSVRRENRRIKNPLNFSQQQLNNPQHSHPPFPLSSVCSRLLLFFSRVTFF